MSEKDIAEKTFIALNDVFADIINGLFFEGKQVITEDSLEDITPTSQYKADEEILHEQERDTYKLWRGHGVNLILLGMENQTKPFTGIGERRMELQLRMLVIIKFHLAYSFRKRLKI